MSLALKLMLFAGFITRSLCSAPAGPWDQFNYAPSSRTVFPVAIHSFVGTVETPDGLLSQHGSATLSGTDSYVTLDFGKEVCLMKPHRLRIVLNIGGLQVGGITSLTVNSAKSTSLLALSFTESPLFISPNTSDTSVIACPCMSNDGVEMLPSPLTTGRFTQPPGLLRGGFRFLSIISKSEDPVTVSNLSVSIAFAALQNLTDYSGYFSTKDLLFHDEDFLTKLWYAGAYTVQTNTIDVHQMRSPVPTGAFVFLIDAA